MDNDVTTTPAAQAFLKDAPPPPAGSFLQLAQKSGIDVQAIQSEVVQEKEKQAPRVDTYSETGLPITPEQQSASKGVVKGVAYGAADLTQNIINTGIGFVDSVENYAAQYGIGRGDLVENNDYINWSEKLGAPEDDISVRASRAITRYGLPMLATIPVAGLRAGLTAGAAVDLLTSDPKQERFIKMIGEEVPELKSFIPAYEWLSSNAPDDSVLEGKFKNMIDGLFIAGPITGVAAGIKYAPQIASKTKDLTEAIYQTIKGNAFIKKYSEMIKTAKTNPAVLDDIAKAEFKSVNVKQADISPEALAAKEATYVDEPIAQSDLYNFEPIKTNSKGEPSFNTNNQDVRDGLLNIVKNDPDILSKLVPESTTFEKLSAEAKKMIMNPQEQQRLYNWRPGDAVLPGDVAARTYMIASSLDDLIESAVKADRSGLVEDSADFAQKQGFFEFLFTQKKGAGKQTAQTLTAHKIIADLSGKRMSEVTKIEGAEARQKLAQNIIDANKNDGKLMKLLADVGRLGDVEAQIQLKKALMKGDVGSKLLNTTSAYVTNNLLSPKTLMMNMVNNLFSTTTNTMVSYAAGGLKFLKSGDVSALKAANAGVSATVGAQWEAIQALGTAIKTGATKNADELIRLELLEGADYFTKEGWGIANDATGKYKYLGKIIDGSGFVLGKANARLNAGADAYFGLVSYRGKLAEIATLDAERIAGLRKGGLTESQKARYVNDMLKDPYKWMHDEAIAHAKKATMSTAPDPNTTMGKALTMLNDSSLKLLFPFTNTSVNIIKYGIEHSPLQLASPSTRRAIFAGGRESELAIAKIAVGSTLLGAGAALSYNGMYSGPETRNYKLARALKESGIGFVPDAIKMFDTSVSMQGLDIAASVVRLGSVLHKAGVSFSKEEYQAAFMDVSAGLMDFVTPELLAEEMGNFFKAVADAGMGGDKGDAEKYLTNFPTRFVPLFNTMKLADNIIDPTTRLTSTDEVDERKIAANKINEMTEKVIKKIQANNPYFSNDLGVQRNFFGEVDLNTWGITTGDNSKAVQVLNKMASFYENEGELNAELDPVQITQVTNKFSVSGIEVRLNNKEHSDFQAYAAGVDPETGGRLYPGVPTLRESLNEVLPKLAGAGTTLTPLQYKKLVNALRSVVDDYKNMGKKHMLDKVPEVKERFLNEVKRQQTPVEGVDVFQ